MNDLKPCPFCGGEAQIDRMGNNRQSMQISCGYCGCSVETGETWVDEDSNWNQRAQPTIADYLEANKEMIEKTKCKVVTIESLKKFGGLE